MNAEASTDALQHMPCGLLGYFNVFSWLDGLNPFLWEVISQIAMNYFCSLVFVLS